MVLLERPLEPLGFRRFSLCRASGGTGHLSRTTPGTATRSHPSPSSASRAAPILSRISPTRRRSAGIVRRLEEVGEAWSGGGRSVGVGRSTLETGRLRRRALDHSRVHNRWGSPGGRGAEGPGYRRLQVSGADRLESGGHDPGALRGPQGDAREPLPRRPVRTERRRCPTQRARRRRLPLREARPRPPRSTRRSGPLPRRDRPPSRRHHPRAGHRGDGWAGPSTAPDLGFGMARARPRAHRGAGDDLLGQLLLARLHAEHGVARAARPSAVGGALVRGRARRARAPLGGRGYTIWQWSAGGGSPASTGRSIETG